MKTLIRAVAIMAMISASGCRTYEGMWDKSQVRNVALQRVGLEQIAWNAHDRSAIPAGMESLLSLKRMSAHVDSVNVEGTAVVQELAPGYLIAGRLLRATMVGVSKGGPAAA